MVTKAPEGAVSQEAPPASPEPPVEPVAGEPVVPAEPEGAAAGETPSRNLVSDLAGHLSGDPDALSGFLRMIHGKNPEAIASAAVFSEIAGPKIQGRADSLVADYKARVVRDNEEYEAAQFGATARDHIRKLITDGVTTEGDFLTALETAEKGATAAERRGLTHALLDRLHQ